MINIAGKENACRSQLVSRLRVSCNLLNPKSSDRVLDVGCGKGILEYHLTKCKNVIGIDINKMDILKAKKKASADFIVASSSHLPFRASCLNKIIAAEVIEHLPTGIDKLSVEEMYRVLSSNGFLVLTTPSHHLYYNVFDPGWFLFHHKHYKSSELTELFRDTSLSIEKMFQRGTIIYAVVMFLHSIFIGFFYELLRKPIPEPVEQMLRLLEQKTDRDFDDDRENGYTWFLKLRAGRWREVQQ